jgi:maleate cis-trans isomerase
MTQAIRIALMVPANNTTMGPEMLAWLPAGSTCRTLRIPRGKGVLAPADLPEYVGQAMTMAKTLADGSVDLVVYGCTAAGFMMGPARDAEIAAELAAVTGRPAVTTASAMVTALEEAAARTIALVTPYSDLVNERLQAFLSQAGIRVGALSSFAAGTVDELAAITAEDIAARARKLVRDGHDALFIACSQLPTHRIIPPLEQELRRPVWSSIRATAWQARRTLTAAAA